MDFATDVYSREPRPRNFRKLVEVIAHNRNLMGKVHSVNDVLSAAAGKLPFRDVRSSGALFGRPGVDVKITIVEYFVEAQDICIGFIKCDTEGDGLPIARGSEKTSKKYRPACLSLFIMISMSFSEFHCSSGNGLQSTSSEKNLEQTMPENGMNWSSSATRAKALWDLTLHERRETIAQLASNMQLASLISASVREE
jgi:hypothetical protein